MSRQLINNIRERMKAKGFASATALSLAAGLPRTYVRDILTEKSKNPTGSRLAKLAVALSCSVDDLTGAAPAPTMHKPDATAFVEPPNASRVDTPSALPHRADMPRDIPMLGVAAAGSDGEFTLNGEPVDFLRRPGGLVHRKGIFAVTSTGDSMMPWRKPREPVYVDELQRPEIGDHIVIELKAETPGDPKPCYVKRLVRRTEKHIVVAQYNPPREFSFPTARVHRIYRALEWSEVLGLGL